jgi:hypothetical protein
MTSATRQCFKSNHVSLTYSTTAPQHAHRVAVTATGSGTITAIPARPTVFALQY